MDVEVLGKQIEGLLGLLPQGTTQPLLMSRNSQFHGIKSLGEESLQGTSGAGTRCHQAGHGILNPCAIYGPWLYFSDNIKL